MKRLIFRHFVPWVAHKTELEISSAAVLLSFFVLLSKPEGGNSSDLFFYSFSVNVL